MRNLNRMRMVVVGVATLGLVGLTACGSSSEPEGSDQQSSPQTPSIDLSADFAGTNEAPPTEGPTPIKGADLWVVSCAASSVGCQAPSEAAKEAGEKLGWKVTIADGNYGVGDGYNVAIRQAIAAKADAIALVGIQCESAVGGMQAAKAAGIPVIGSWTFDCPNDPLLTAGVQMNAAHPELEDWLKAWGAVRARWLIDATDGKAQVIVPKLVNNPAGLLPYEGFVAELADKCPDCKVVDSVEFSDPDIGSGVYAQKLAASIVAHPEANSAAFMLDVFLLAGNAPAAIAGTGRAMTVASGEGLAPVIELIRADKVGAIAGFDTGWLGYGIVDTVNRVLNNEPAVPEGIGWQLMDKTSTLPAAGSGYSTSVDFRSAYLKLWQVQ